MRQRKEEIGADNCCVSPRIVYISIIKEEIGADNCCVSPRIVYISIIKENKHLIIKR